jgi:hypothetical protein
MGSTPLAKVFGVVAEPHRNILLIKGLVTLQLRHFQFGGNVDLSVRPVHFHSTGLKKQKLRPHRSFSS